MQVFSQLNNRQAPSYGPSENRSETLSDSEGRSGRAKDSKDGNKESDRDDVVLQKPRSKEPQVDFPFLQSNALIFNNWRFQVFVAEVEDRDKIYPMISQAHNLLYYRVKQLNSKVLNPS